jgi:hypothetical protein
MPSLKPLNAIVIALATLGATISSAGDFRASLRTGYGSNSITTTTQTLGQSNFAVAGEMDFALDSRRTVGIEVMRTLSSSDLTSSTGVTGFVFKQYFLNPLPVRASDLEGVEHTTVYQRSFAPYLGASSGYGSAVVQGKRPGLGLAASGIYLAAKAGFDLPISGPLGLQAELAYGSTFGGEAFQILSATGGICFLF